MQSNRRPVLSITARDLAKGLGDDFHAHLVAVSEDLASAGKYEQVQCPHVYEALLALKRSGMKPPAPPPIWYHRPDFRVAIGSVLLGLSPSVSGLALAIFVSFKDHPVYCWIFVAILPILMALGGLCLALTGWVQGMRD